MNKKIVNIYPTAPILSTNPPIRTMAYKITKPVKDIRACIIAGAKVEEVLPNGTTIRLNLNNYDKDHTAIYHKLINKGPEATKITKNIPTEDIKLNTKAIVSEAPIDAKVKSETTSDEPINEEKTIDRPVQFGKRKKNKKKHQANTDKVVDSTDEEESSEVSTVEATVSADAVDTDLVETIDVETLS